MPRMCHVSHYMILRFWNCGGRFQENDLAQSVSTREKLGEKKGRKIDLEKYRNEVGRKAETFLM